MTRLITLARESYGTYDTQMVHHLTYSYSLYKLTREPPFFNAALRQALSATKKGRCLPGQIHLHIGNLGTTPSYWVLSSKGTSTQLTGVLPPSRESTRSGPRSPTSLLPSLFVKSWRRSILPRTLKGQEGFEPNWTNRVSCTRFCLAFPF